MRDLPRCDDCGRPCGRYAVGTRCGTAVLRCLPCREAALLYRGGQGHAPTEVAESGSNVGLLLLVFLVAAAGLVLAALGGAL